MEIRPLLNLRPDSAWTSRLSQPGWLLLPLRFFLGVTFSYAGLQKLANPEYLDPHSPTSVASQLRLLRHSSPIGPLLAASTHAPALVGLLIAFGELAVGVGTLVAFYPRLAAFGGALLSLTFFLTVSWNTTPYYYGSDLVFCFAWLTILAFGDTGVLSLQAWLAQWSRLPRPASPRPGSPRPGSPRPGSSRPRRPSAAELDRRAVVVTGVATALLAGLTLALGGITAALGRAVRGTKAQGRSAPAGLPSAGPSPSASGSHSGGSGTVIAAAADIAVGQAKSFTDPASGNPAWVVHSAASSFVAFSAVCTHAGCPVQYDPSNVQFVCPCHGGIYDAHTGKVLQGPPPAALPAIPVQLVAGQLQVNQ
jgi:thiosulfate dehydrogenase [quinone] large subunit